MNQTLHNIVVEAIRFYASNISSREKNYLVWASKLENPWQIYWDKKKEEQDCYRNLNTFLNFNDLQRVTREYLRVVGMRRACENKLF